MLDTADIRFLGDFENGTLSPEDFDHEGHVHAAWCCLEEYGDLGGRERFVTALHQFVRIHGAQDKYHDTITRAFLDVIAAHTADSKNWATFRRRNPAIIDNGMGLLLKHYSHDVLFSDAARAGYVEPDLLPFPAAGDGARR